MCFGDFNEILSIIEKMGGMQRPQHQMDDFQAAINECGFKDLGYNGPDYTWCNMQEGERKMYLRLDRVFATLDWVNHFKEARVHHIVESTSDHCALLLPNSLASQPPRKCRFLFETLWTRREDCRDIIIVTWNSNMNISSPTGMALGLK